MAGRRRLGLAGAYGVARRATRPPIVLRPGGSGVRPGAPHDLMVDPASSSPGRPVERPAGGALLDEPRRRAGPGRGRRPRLGAGTDGSCATCTAARRRARATSTTRASASARRPSVRWRCQGTDLAAVPRASTPSGSGRCTHRRRPVRALRTARRPPRPAACSVSSADHVTLQVDLDAAGRGRMQDEQTPPPSERRRRDLRRLPAGRRRLDGLGYRPTRGSTPRSPAAGSPRSAPSDDWASRRRTPGSA